MKAPDQFHVGIVTDEFEATKDELAGLFGYEWCADLANTMSVTLPEGARVVDNLCVYSRTAPRIELVRSVPGTAWEADTSGIHHLGYWSDDVAADCALLEARGYRREIAGTGEDGAPYWAYLRPERGPRIELVSRALQPGMEQYWAAP